MNDSPRLAGAYRPFRCSGLSFSQVNYFILALLSPIIIKSIMLYGIYSVRILAASLFFALLWDAVFEKIGGKKSTLHDGSAALTGLLLGMLLPPLAPWWLIAVASAAALFLGKQLFGGIGGSPFNAVCIGWAVAMISWPSLIDPTYGSVGLSLSTPSAYPLSELHRLGGEAAALFSVKDLLMGRQVGTLGTGASLIILMCGVAGVIIRLIPWQIPVSLFAGMAASAALLSAAGIAQTGSAPFHLLTGFTCLGAFFIATDCSSRPMSWRNMLLYGFFTGVLTICFRVFGKFPEGFPFAVLLVNVFMPLFDSGKAPETATMPEVVRV